MKNIFNIVIFPALLVVSFATFAEDRGGDRVNNGLVDQSLTEKPTEKPAEGAIAGKADKKAVKQVKCAKDDKDCLKKQAELKKKALEDAGNPLEAKKKEEKKAQ